MSHRSGEKFWGEHWRGALKIEISTCYQAQPGYFSWTREVPGNEVDFAH